MVLMILQIFVRRKRISFTNEAVKQSSPYQNVTTAAENVETTYDNIATSQVQKHIVNMVEIIPTTVFNDLIGKELFSKIKKKLLGQETQFANTQTHRTE